MHIPVETFASILGHLQSDMSIHELLELRSTLFVPQGLQYWLPLYNAASPTVYSNAKQTLCRFYMFRNTHSSAQLQHHQIDSMQQSLVIDVLVDPSSTPEYTRLFTIDAFNQAMSSKNENIIDAFLTSETGKRLGCLTSPSAYGVQ